MRGANRSVNERSRVEAYIFSVAGVVGVGCVYLALANLHE